MDEGEQTIAHYFDRHERSGYPFDSIALQVAIFQMGVIFYWVIDESPNQERSQRLLALAAKSVTALVRISALPLMRPVRKAALELVEIVQEVSQ